MQMNGQYQGQGSEEWTLREAGRIGVQDKG